MKLVRRTMDVLRERASITLLGSGLGWLVERLADRVIDRALEVLKLHF